jgi:prepilin-type N-terminal cleavage/methylation domain-containing protein
MMWPRKGAVAGSAIGFPDKIKMTMAHAVNTLDGCCASRAMKVLRGRPAVPAAGRRGLGGFTLIELLVVVSIVALLLALLLPSLARARQQSVIASCGSNLKQIGTGFTMYLADHRDRYPCATDPVSTSPRYWLWMGRGFRRFIGPYFVHNINVNNPSILVCPSDPTPPEVFERTSYAYSMAFYHSPEQIDGMSSPADTYTNPRPSIAQSAGDVRHPGRKILAGEWLSYHEPVSKDNGWWDNRGSRLFLFADNHVAKCAATAIAPANDNLPDPNLTKHGVGGMDTR